MRGSDIMIIGYAHIFTDDQKLNRQQTALKDAGCSKIYEDKRSGGRSDRPGL
jgi:DNA invertase Pin-like site-specific DNA recombinase